VPKKDQALLAMRDIAARIRAARHTAGLSQEEAAGRAKIGYKRWQEIEGARVNATIRTLARMAAALDVDFWDIVRRSAGRRRAGR
jgi:transcriptional regulator with XRE-family HTH domain